MNPIYTGKDVSFIDTKQAQRIAGETERALHAQMASVGHALRRLGEGRRAVLAYTQA